MLVKDFMHPNIFHIGSQATLLEVAEKLLANRVDTLLVLEGEELLGVIGIRDLFTAPIPAHYGNSMLKHDNEMQLLRIWKTIQVQNLMNDKVLSVDEDTTLLRAIELMVNSGKHPLPVVRDGKVVGIISRMDIVRALVTENNGRI